MLLRTRRPSHTPLICWTDGTSSCLSCARTPPLTCGVPMPSAPLGMSAILSFDRLRVYTVSAERLGRVVIHFDRKRLSCAYASQSRPVRAYVPVVYVTSGVGVSADGIEGTWAPL